MKIQISALYVCVLFCFGCNSISGIKEPDILTIIKSNKNDTIEYLDLSSKSLNDIPDLSKYKINKIDLSDNNFDSIPFLKLPKYLKVLDMSKNNIKGGVHFTYTTRKGYSLFNNNISENIEEIYLSNNKIEGISIFVYNHKLKRLDFSNNRLIILEMNEQKGSYLNLSNNKKFDNVVRFNPKNFDTIVSMNIKNNMPLRLIELKKRTGIKN